jgi:choline dehydrogenase-like flavoprotein
VVFDWRTYTNPFDIEIMLLSLRFSRKFIQTDALKVYNPVEVSPGPDVQSDEELTEYLRATSSPTTGHQCCTLSIGAASDSRARLKGVKGVRIADSSVWPFVPGAHATQQTAYVVGEKVSSC